MSETRAASPGFSLTGCHAPQCRFKVAVPSAVLIIYTIGQRGL
jgi:hypothetical protein